MLKINNQIIESTETHKFLGLIIDSKLTWKQHILYLKKKSHKTLNLFKCLSHLHWGANRKTLMKLYTMLMKPQLDYGSEIYGSAKESVLKMLEPIQNAALRLATGAFRTTPVVSLQAESGMMSLQYQRHYKTLNYLTKIRSIPDHPLSYILENNNNEEPQNTKIVTISDQYLQLTRLYNIPTVQIMQIPIHISPPWHIFKFINTCTELYSIKKNSMNPATLRNIFQEHLNLHRDDLKIFTDGSKTNSGTAFAFTSEENSVSRTIPKHLSVFTAEIMAINEAIKYGIQTDNSNITIISDSRSSIQAINEYNSKHPIIREIQQQAIRSKKKLTLCWVPSHIGVTQNEIADELARNATERESENCLIPHNEIKIKIKQEIEQQCQQRWFSLSPSAVKLREIKNRFGPFENCDSSNRKWEVILMRLRVGHSRLTHGFLMEGGLQPVCRTCNSTLTIKHILTECRDYDGMRRRYLRGSSFGDMLCGRESEERGGLFNFIMNSDLKNKL